MWQLSEVVIFVIGVENLYTVDYLTLVKKLSIWHSVVDSFGITVDGCISVYLT